MNIENILKDITEHERKRFAKYNINSHCMICGEDLGERKEYVSIDGDTGYVCPQCFDELEEAER